MADHTIADFLKQNKESIMTLAIIFLTSIILFSILGISFKSHRNYPHPVLVKELRVET